MAVVAVREQWDPWLNSAVDLNMYSNMKFCENTSNVIFSIGIVLTTATQLRLINYPIGPGELLLLLWMVISIVSLLRSGRIFITPIAEILILFWVTSSILLFVGWLVAQNVGISDESSYHTASSFLFTATLIIIFTLLANV